MSRQPGITPAATVLLTLIALFAFAANSILCRLALRQAHIDAASFTLVRVLSGALTLWLIARPRSAPQTPRGSWGSALALFAYAAAFSFAYVTLPAASGALVLFGAVQLTMIGYGLWSGERLNLRQALGLACALGGLAGLLLPGATAPPLPGALLMLLAGVAWGIYSLRGRGAADPIGATAGNFQRAVPFALALGVAAFPYLSLNPAGFWYACCSGALASGLGYGVWYKALAGLRATSAATVQLSVPVLAALGAVVVLGEAVTLRLLLASVATLGGIALFVLSSRPRSGPGRS